MLIKSFESGPLLTVGYLVIDEKSNYAVVIDAPKDSAEVIVNEAKKINCEILCLINTHGHWDHIADDSEIVRLTAAKVAIHRKDAHLLEDPKSVIYELPFRIEGIKPDIILNDGDIIEVGDMRLKVIHTPGHTLGSICLYEEKEKILFSGDTLFAGTIGRTDLPGGSYEEIIKSIQEKLFVLDDDVVVYPGHGPSTTIGKEKQFNPFFNEMDIK
ncbi:MAG: MBL fold metallo-hydrolase [Candidatus Kryptonium sp.]|nr:MBL fold metallo-hydrolase [Candidatus Kryptonium sp.]MDW8108337.1 MBL fold metallo-hydrolase [Candidatus Kryptonium sp.]